MGGGPGGGMGSDDVKLKYTDDDPESYSNIFDSAKTDVTDADKTRLISSLKSLSEYEDLEDVLDIDKVLRYFVVHNYVVNGDSYTGSMIHNYYLYESDGKMQMIPWDYNLAYGTFQGNDASGSVNAPIDSPILSGGGGGGPQGRDMQGDDSSSEDNNMPQMPEFAGNSSSSEDNNMPQMPEFAGNSSSSEDNNMPQMPEFAGDNSSSEEASVDDRPMVGWIFSSDEYTQLYHEYFKKFTKELLDSGYVSELITSTGELIDPYVKKDPTSFYEYEDFVEAYPMLNEFIKLRTKSVEGQLNGTIPSTDEGQEEDSSSLIDASTLDIDKLGGMNDTHQNDNMQGGPPGFNDQQNTSDESGAQTQQTSGNSGTQAQQSNEASNNMPQPPDNMGMQTDQENDNMEAGSAVTATDYIYLGCSFVLLLVGIAIAAMYKRRKNGV